MLKMTRFGNPVLREVARKLSAAELASEPLQQLIRDMQIWLRDKPKYGVGLAAPQVGHSVAISVIAIKSTPYRPTDQAINMVLVNPEIITTYSRRSGMWEGCISFGTSTRDFPYAQALRYKRIRVRHTDERGMSHEADYDGLLAHVMQHEIDHLQGILFVERIRDSRTIMMKSEFMKLMRAKQKLIAATTNKT